MSKVIRLVLYGLAIVSGVAGLFAGGIPLAKYAIERLKNPRYGYYYDPNYLFSSEFIFLLSLILLICVRIGLAMDKGIRPANSPNPVSSGKQTDELAPTKEVVRTSGTAETAAQPLETADEKLTRLLNPKKD